MPKLRAIIADDEANLSRYLSELLARLWPELDVIATAANGAEALALIREEEPDIAFLDIRMPLLSGIQVANRVQGECHVVFVTAYDEYAVQAFESAAIDYLLKPVEQSRLAATVERLKSHLVVQALPDEVWRQTVTQLAGHFDSAHKDKYMSWIRAAQGEHTQLIPVDDVIYFKAEEKYTTVATREQEFLIRKAIKELAVELDPDRFWQIHRACIVQVGQISKVKKIDNGGYQVHLKDRHKVLNASRRYAHLFKQM